MKKKRSAALIARAERAESRGNARLARYLFVRAEDVLDTKNRARKIRPTSSRFPSGDRRRVPYTEEDDLYRAGRSAENCVARLVRLRKETNEPRISEERERRRNQIRRNTRRGFSKSPAKVWDIIGR